MRGRIRNSRLFAQPTLFVLVAGAVFLPITVFALLKIWPSSSPTDVRSDVSEVSVIYVWGDGYERKELRFWAMRDGVYYREYKQVGLFGLTSHRTQYKGLVPAEFPLEALQAAVTSKAFKATAAHWHERNNPAWYVHVNTEGSEGCFVLSESDAASPSFAPVRDWFTGIQLRNPNEERAVLEAWADADPDSVIRNWCEGYD